MDKIVRIIILDDDDFQRQGLCSIIEQQPDFKVVHQFDWEIRDTLPIREIEFDVAILHVKMPMKQNLVRLEMVFNWLNQKPFPATLVISEQYDESDIIQIVRYGATGFLPGTLQPGELYEAIRQLSSGQFYIPSRIAYVLLQKIGRDGRLKTYSTLTPQQLKILKLLVYGKTNREIAKSMHVSERTVEAHARQIYKKLNVTNRTQASMSAVQMGLVQIEES